jgi:hypothetical protein
MAKTLSNLRSNTRLLLDEAIAADWSNPQVDAAINYGYHEIVTTVAEIYDDYYSKDTTLDVVEDQQEYGISDGMPSDFLKLRRVEIKYDSASTAISQRALPISLDDVSRDLGNTTLGYAIQRSPAYYLRGMGSSRLKLGFIPVPDEDVTNGIKIWYVYTVTDLSATTDEVDIPYPDRFARLISYAAAADLLRKGQQEEDVAIRYRIEFEAGMEKMKQQLEDRKADDVKGVTDVVNLNLWFDRYHSV